MPTGRRRRWNHHRQHTELEKRQAACPICQQCSPHQGRPLDAASRLPWALAPHRQWLLEGMGQLQQQPGASRSQRLQDTDEPRGPLPAAPHKMGDEHQQPQRRTQTTERSSYASGDGVTYRKGRRESSHPKHCTGNMQHLRCASLVLPGVGKAYSKLLHEDSWGQGFHIQNKEGP